MKKITGNLLLFALIITFWGASAQDTPKDYRTYPHWIDMMQDPESNFFETQKAFNEYWEGREMTKGSGYKLFKRWEYWMEKQVSPEGKKPSPYRDLEAIKALRSGNRNSTMGEWVSLGPSTVPSGYNGYRGLGRVNAIGFHPTDVNTIYIGAPSGGLWITHDGGTTWESHTDILPTLGISAVIVDYVNPDVVYIGTGDRDAGDAPGAGIWKSFDGGITFEPSNVGMEQGVISKLLIHPTLNNVIITATGSGIYRSENGGTTWTKTVSGNFKDVVFKPGNPDVVYAASSGRFYRSVNNAVTFEEITNGLTGGYRGAIAVSPEDPEVVYFLVTNSESFKGLYLSTNSGITFNLQSTSPNIMSWNCDGGSGGQAWYDLDIACDPTNADIIYAGGVNCFKSSNAGLTWTINSHWYGGCGVPSVHADLHVLEYNPITNRLYAGNDGGVYWTDNGGLSWTEISNGLVISQAYKIGQSATYKDYVINGYQDNGTSSYTGPEWVSVGGGDGMECAYDPTNEAYSYSTIYYGSIDRHQNHGYDGQIAGEGVNGITESGAWVTPFLIDHYDGNVMFIGYDNIWRSNNIKSPNADNVVFVKISSMNMNDFDVMAQSDANTDILYASSGSVLYRSDNVKGLSVQWTNLTQFLPIGNTITALETSPVDENVVYIVQQNRVFKSGDKGISWTEITDNLPDVQMNTIVYYHNSREGLYLGTNIGVFYRDVDTPEWILYSNGLPAAARITELEIYYSPDGAQFDVLRAGTYGRGLWETPLYYTDPTADFTADKVLVPISCPVNFTDLSSGVPFTREWHFEGGTPATSTDKNPQGIMFEQAGTYNITLIVSNLAGNDTIVKQAYIEASSTLLPLTDFTSTRHAFCTGDTAIVYFTDKSEYCPTGWLWEFEPTDVTFLEGTNANSPNPVVAFNSDNTYSVTLTVTNINGSATITHDDYVVMGGMALPFTEDWESGEMQPNGWEVVNPDNNVTWDIYTISTDSSVNKTARMNFWNYNVAPGRRDQLISPPMNFSGYNNAYLGFEHSYIRRFAQVSDSLLIHISTDCGETWTKVTAFGEDGTGIFETYPVSIVEIVPQSPDDWCNGTDNPVCNLVDLSAWVGNENVKIMFETVHRRGNNLYIDNIFVSAGIGVNDEKLSSIRGIDIYPNPGNNLFQLRSEDELVNPAVQIYTAGGKQVYSHQLPSGREWSINTGNLPEGFYLIKVISANGSWNEKLIIK